MKKEINLTALKALSNPKECKKLFLQSDDFYQYVWALKRNFEDSEKIISNFYKKNDLKLFLKAVYLIYSLDGAERAYEFIKQNGSFENLHIESAIFMELLVLLLRIYGEVGGANDINFLLHLMESQLSCTLPRTLALPDLYTHASLHAQIAKCIQRSKEESWFSQTKDLVILDVQNDELILTDILGRSLVLENRDITIAAMMRVRNESDNIGIVLESIAAYADVIILYDDCSTDDTVNIVKTYQEKGFNIDLIEGEEWLFNEALIHQIIVDRGRKIGVTHFFQLDADEIFSHELSPKIFRDLMMQMQVGDILALPWLNVNDDISGYYSEEKLIGLLPSRGLKRYKDIAFADDGFTQFGEWQYAHVNTSPFVYTRRFLSMKDSLSLIHLEQINLINYAVKKDWYRIRAYAQNGKLPSDPYADIRLPLLQLEESIVYFKSKVYQGDKRLIDIFRKPVLFRIESNAHGCTLYPDIKDAMYIRYDLLMEQKPLYSISEK